MSDELKPCPFCGSPAALANVDEPSNVGGRVIQCGTCLASSPVMFPCMDSADEPLKDAWNRRCDNAAKAEAVMAFATWLQKRHGGVQVADAHRYLAERGWSLPAAERSE